MQRLSAQIRQAILEQRYPEFVRQFVAMQFPKGNVPEWVVEGCCLAGISLQQPTDGAAGCYIAMEAELQAGNQTATREAAGKEGAAPAAAALVDREIE